MIFDWTSVLTGVLIWIVILIVKLMLDFRIGRWLVICFHWIPVRTFFRKKPPKLKGIWNQVWNTDSSNFQEKSDRTDNCKIKQLGNYCYAEFYAKGRKYYLFGEIIGNNLVGKWHDHQDEFGYGGAFELRIINSDKLVGKFVGHSQESSTIKCDDWKWTRNS